jgi:uncharacterized protein (DUF302 family)
MWSTGFPETHEMKSAHTVALLALLLVASFARAAGTDVVTRAIRGEFEDVKTRVTLSIEGRGLVVNYTSRVGDMLQRTGKDIGSSVRIYARAEVLEFCSARLSRDTMEADPRNIVFCPYAIAIYTLPHEPESVYVAYRKPAVRGSAHSIAALRAVGQLLDEIAREALD